MVRTENILRSLEVSAFCVFIKHHFSHNEFWVFFIFDLVYLFFSVFTLELLWNQFPVYSVSSSLFNFHYQNLHFFIVIYLCFIRFLFLLNFILHFEFQYLIIWVFLIFNSNFFKIEIFCFFEFKSIILLNFQIQTQNFI